MHTVLPIAAVLTLAASLSVAGAPPAKKMSPKAKATPPGAARTAPAPLAGSFIDNTPLTNEQKMLHALNRVGFGPRPGDVERIQAMGLNAYIAQQLQPEKIADTAVDTKVALLTLLQQPAGEMAVAYFESLKGGQELKKMAAARQAQAGTATPDLSKRETRADAMESLTPEQREMVRTYAEQRRKVDGAVVQLAIDKVIRAVESEKQLQEVLVDFWSNHFNIDVSKKPCNVYKIADDREVIRPHVFATFRALLGASAHSPAMLVYLDNFRSTVPSPAAQRLRKRMEEAVKARAAQGDKDAQLVQTLQMNGGKGGINENYAREIMELHTLGVDGGYTQKDVQEVARCFTGWTLGGQRRPGTKGGVGEGAGTFRFAPAAHDNGEKTVLGRTIPAGGGEKDGEMVLDILANHPATMKFISTKLCRRLVADEPPASLVNKCVATWKATGGDLRQIVRTIVTAPEFYSRAAYRQKIKSPFEYAVSSVRALGGTVDLQALQNAAPARGGGNLAGKNPSPALRQTLLGQIATLGQPLFQYQAPTGYPEDSRKWVSSGALIGRLNFALALAGGRVPDITLPDLAAQGSDPKRVVDEMSARLLHGEVSPSTRATLLKQAQTAPTAPGSVAAQTSDTSRVVALVLGAPEFQRR